jgi:hypothetical protein
MTPTTWIFTIGKPLTVNELLTFLYSLLANNNADSPGYALEQPFLNLSSPPKP